MNFADLRIALVGPCAPPAGGMANQLRQFTDLLQGEGAAVAVVQTNRPIRPAWLARFRGVRALARLVPYCAALWRTIGGCDVVHVFANSGWSWHLFAAPALRVAHLRSVPCLVHYHGGQAEGFLARSPRVVRALRGVHSVVVPSAYLHDVFASHGVQSHVVPNLLDVAAFSVPPRRCGHPPQLAVTRNLERVYDIPTALRAFERIRDHVPGALLTVAGSGPEEAALRALASSLALDGAVAFTGSLTSGEVATLLARVDVMLNPSIADNLPVSILEAMASGVAVVSTRVGGVPYLLRDGESALLVDAGDFAGMADAALRLLGDGALRQRIAQKAREDVQQYSAPRVRVALAAAYDAMLSGAPPRHVLCR
jgi:glycosyltransferase involved in cell wall biosynthesis